MSLEFTTAKRRTEPIKFTLDGDEYTFVPPKTASMLLPVLDVESNDRDSAYVKAALDWLENGLPTEQAAKLESRLRDPEDDLDIDTLDSIIQKLAEEAAGRPTGSS